MYFITKGEFIQGLKDYYQVCNLLRLTKDQYERAYYLRYEKVKSSLDYEIVGYDAKGESIRSIKGRSSVNKEQIAEKNEHLDEKLAEYSEKIKSYEGLINKVNDELYLLDEPLQSIVRERYKEHKKLKTICNKFSELCLDESGMYKYIMRELEKYYAPK